MLARSLAGSLPHSLAIRYVVHRLHHVSRFGCLPPPRSRSQSMNGLTDCVDVRRRADDDDDDDDDAFWQDSVCPSHNPCTAVKRSNSNGRFFPPNFRFQETQKRKTIISYFDVEQEHARSGKKTESFPSLPVRGETRNERRARVRAPPHVPPQLSSARRAAGRPSALSPMTRMTGQGRLAGRRVS